MSGYIEDAEYWGLVGWEKVHFFGRISQYYGRQSRKHGAKAERYFRIGGWLALSQAGLWVLILLLKIISWAVADG